MTPHQTPDTPPGETPGNPIDRLAGFSALLAAEAAAEAGPAGAEALDLEQAVWLRVLERGAVPSGPVARWLSAAVRAEARAFRRRARREVPYAGFDAEAAHAAPVPSAEGQVLAAENRRAFHAVVRRLPGRCPELISALMSCSDPTYREISRELGISQGSLGPLRSRCLSCLRALLGEGVEIPQLRGKTR